MDFKDYSMLDLIGNTPLVEAGNIEKDQELESVSGQLAEADEQIIALYEKLAGGQEVSE